MGFVFLILYLTLSFVQPVLFFPALAPYRVVLLIGIAGLIASVPHVMSSHVIFRSVQLYAVIGFVGAVCMSVIVGEHWFHGAFWAFGDICTCLVPLVLVLLNVRTCGRVRFIAGLFIALILFLLTCAVVSYHTGYRADLFQVRPGEISGDFEEDVGLVRIRGLGIMSDPNDFGVGLVVAMALCGMFWKRGGVLGNAILIVPCQLFLVYGAYLTRSRGTFIAIVVLVLFVTRRWFGNAASVLATGLAVLGFLRMDFTSGRILSATDESAMGRLNAWSAGLTELRTHPVFGVGYRNFTAYNDLTAHNSFVLCFTELGLLGYFFWLAILAVTNSHILHLAV